MTEIQRRLFELQDPKYRDFTAKLMPTVDKETVIGIRTPALRKLGRELRKDPAVQVFLKELPHRYFEEYGLHSFLISDIRDFDTALTEVERLLPYIDNWANCDGLSPIAFAKRPDLLLTHMERWLCSDHTYTVRFAVKCYMNYFLDERFDTKHLDRVAAIRSNEYYVNMMVAWYFSTALAKQYEATVPYIEDHRLDTWTHNKAIQKAVESYRVTDEQKAYLKTLKIKKK